MIGALQQMIDDAKKGVTDYTKDGKCSSCGQCCSNLLPITLKEVETIRRYVEKHHIRPQKHNFPVVAIMYDLTCPFRSDVEKKCLIYPVRPGICRDFRCDKTRNGLGPNRSLYRENHYACDMRETFFSEREDKPCLK